MSGKRKRAVGTRSTASDISRKVNSTDRVEPVPTTLHEDAPPYHDDSSPSPLRGLEPLGKGLKEFAKGEGPQWAERAGTSESLGRGEVAPLRFIDLFCGIGGFRLAFERAGARCVFSSDWDKFSQQTYAANFGETPHGDIHSVAVADIPKFDILCGGFPCQPFSQPRGRLQEKQPRPQARLR